MRALLALAVVVGCRQAPPPLAPAGTIGDDGAGVLARMSARIDLEAARLPSPEDGSAHPDEGDPLAAFGGFGYGGFGYGGLTYGGLLEVMPGLGDRWRQGTLPESRYQVLSAGPVGAIEGRVAWAGTAVRWPAGCADAPAPATGAPVEGAIAYLKVVERGILAPMTDTAVVTAGPCALRPLTQLAKAVPSMAVLDNPADGPVELVVGGQPVPLGAGGRTDAALERFGPMRVASAGRASAWIMVAEHPYFAISDRDGRFALDHVPPGRYTLVVWHPPVALGLDAGEPRWSQPLVVEQAVVVTTDGLATVALSLTPR